MKFLLANGAPLDATADLLAICVSGAPGRDPNFKAADKALGGWLTQQVKEERFEGKTGQTLETHTGGKIKAKRVVVLGAGNDKHAPVAAIRDLSAQAVKIGRQVGARSVCFVPPKTSAAQLAAAAQHAAEGGVLGAYRFLRYKASKGKKSPDVAKLSVCFGGKKPTAAQTKAIREALRRGETVGHAVNNARDLINEPAAYMTPSQMAAEARAIGRKHASVQVKVLGAAACHKLGMGMFLSVGQGSTQESKLIHMIYKPKGKAKRRVALIGKGVTFDSGGYSLKPSASMEDMKVDMSGAAAVVSAMAAIAELGSDSEVHVVAACCENMVSGGAYKLGDVLTGMDGTTVEINNTDAEGRLTLADAISYTRAKIKPDEMFDFATLTGACMVALGPYTAAVMSADDKLAKGWLAAADASGEDMWRLPLNERLRSQLKSNIADMRNTGERWGGAITAGLFLKHFAKDSTWLHVDIAGPASVNRASGATPRGGTGFAVATMVEYLTR